MSTWAMKEKQMLSSTKDSNHNLPSVSDRANLYTSDLNVPPSVCTETWPAGFPSATVQWNGSMMSTSQHQKQGIRK
jgi:hypothetical protein